MLPVKQLAPRILMAFNYCGCQLARRLGWASTADFRNDGATQHSEVRKHSLQYGRKPDGRFREWVATRNLGSVSGKAEVCEELRKRMINVCCLQEVRLRGLSARMLGMKGR